VEVQIVKKIIFASVSVLFLVFVLSGCGVFSTPELGAAWNAKGSADITTAYSPLEVMTYSLDVKLQFGDIWDANKVKSGTVDFGPAIVSEERIDTFPKYTVIDGSYDTTTKLLTLQCQEAGKTKITLRGTVVNKNEISNGTIHDPNVSIGSFSVNKQ